MKKLFTFAFTLLVFMHLTDTSAFAQGRGKGQGQSQGQAPKTKVDRPIDKQIDKPIKEPKVAKEQKQPNGDFEGFKSHGQLVAAQNISKNLNIPFDQLRAKMTGGNPMSLGKAIKEL